MTPTRMRLLAATVACALLLAFCIIQLRRLPGPTAPLRSPTARAPIWPLPKALSLLGAGLSAVALLVLLGALFDDGKGDALRRQPAFDVRFTNGTVLSDDLSGSVGGAGAAATRAYGTDANAEEIIGFFDRALVPLGYSPVPATPDDLTRLDRAELIRQYQNGSSTYRVYLRPLPLRVGGRTIRGGFRHILVTRLSN